MPSRRVVRKRKPGVSYTARVRRGSVRDVTLLRNGRYAGGVAKMVPKRKGTRTVFLSATSAGPSSGNIRLHPTQSSAARRFPKPARSVIMKHL